MKIIFIKSNKIFKCDCDPTHHQQEQPWNGNELLSSLPLSPPPAAPEIWQMIRRNGWSEIERYRKKDRKKRDRDRKLTHLSSLSGTRATRDTHTHLAFEIHFYIVFFFHFFFYHDTKLHLINIPRERKKRLLK